MAASWALRSFGNGGCFYITFTTTNILKIFFFFFALSFALNRFLHYHLHSSKIEMTNWLKADGQNILTRLATCYQLGSDAFFRPRRPHPAHICPWLTVSSSMMTCLLMHQVFVKSNSAARRDQCVQVVKQWFRMSLDGLINHGQAICLHIELVDSTHALQVEPSTGIILGFDVFVAAMPWFVRYWDRIGHRFGGLQSSPMQPTLFETLLVLASVPPGRAAKMPWLSDMLSGLCRLVAFGTEYYADRVYLPLHGRLKPVQRLQGAFLNFRIYKNRMYKTNQSLICLYINTYKLKRYESKTQSCQVWSAPGYSTLSLASALASSWRH